MKFLEFSSDKYNGWWACLQSFECATTWKSLLTQEKSKTAFYPSLKIEFIHILVETLEVFYIIPWNLKSLLIHNAPSFKIHRTTKKIEVSWTTALHLQTQAALISFAVMILKISEYARLCQVNWFRGLTIKSYKNKT